MSLALSDVIVVNLLESKELNSYVENFNICDSVELELVFQCARCSKSPLAFNGQPPMKSWIAKISGLQNILKLLALTGVNKK